MTYNMQNILHSFQTLNRALIFLHKLEFLAGRFPLRDQKLFIKDSVRMIMKSSKLILTFESF